MQAVIWSHGNCFPDTALQQLNPTVLLLMMMMIMIKSIKEIVKMMKRRHRF